MDTGREAPFDNVVFTGAQLLRVPTFYLTLVGHDRVWSKASVGPELVSWSRVGAFCIAVVEQGRMLSVSNILEDSRFGPSVVGGGEDSTSRFAIGIPVAGPGNHWIGCLCAIDVRPRSLSPRVLMSLQHLATQAGELLQLRAPLSFPLPRN